MPAFETSTIAQLLCCQSLSHNFARMVGELDSCLERMNLASHKISWDCDDVATFDLSGTRILLAWNELEDAAFTGVLTVSVGPSPISAPPSDKPDYEALCHRLVEMAGRRVVAADIRWHQLACHMDADWVDVLIDGLPDRLLSEHEPAQLPDEVLAAFSKSLAAQNASRYQPLEDQGNLHYLRPNRPAPAAGVAVEAEELPNMSVPMRLAVHSMNMTLVMVWLPLGAAAVAHGLWKGEDMRVASWLMVATGTLAGMYESPVGQQLIHFVGV